MKHHRLFARCFAANRGNVLVLCGLFVLGAASTVAAKTPSPSTTAEHQDNGDVVVYRAASSVIFTGAEIDGEVQAPSGQWTRVLRKPKVRNLIELRAHFRPELFQSTGQL